MPPCFGNSSANAPAAPKAVRRPAAIGPARMRIKYPPFVSSRGPSANGLVQPTFAKSAAVSSQDRALERVGQWQIAPGAGKRRSKRAVDDTRTPNRADFARIKAHVLRRCRMPQICSTPLMLARVGIGAGDQRQDVGEHL